MTDTERLDLLIEWATEKLPGKPEPGVNAGWLKNVIAGGREGIDAAEAEIERLTEQLAINHRRRQGQMKKAPTPKRRG